MWPNYSDVPASRGKVGAMGWSGNHYPAKITKPYIYRGWGYDLFDPDNAYLVRQPQPFIHPEEVADVVTEWLRSEAAADARRMLEDMDAPLIEPKPKRKAKTRRVPRQPQSPPVPRAALPFPPLPPEDPRPADRVSRNLKPAPGWRPLTGDDIDSILEEL